MTIEIRNLDETISPLQFMKGARNALPAASKHVQGKVAKYPPQMPTVSGYRRTGTLGRNWTSKVNIGTLSAVIGNITHYGSFVQGSPGQTAEMARRNWQTTQQVSTSETGTVVAFFKREIDKVLAGGR